MENLGSSSKMRGDICLYLFVIIYHPLQVELRKYNCLIPQTLCSIEETSCRISVVSGIEVIDIVYKEIKHQTSDLGFPNHINITCSLKVRHGYKATFKIFDDTGTLIKTSSLLPINDNSSRTFLFTLNEDLFHGSADDSLFAFPLLNFEIQDIDTKNTTNIELIVKGTFTRIGEMISTIFKPVEQVQGSIKDDTDCCNQNTMLTILLNDGSKCFKKVMFLIHNYIDGKVGKVNTTSSSRPLA